jgi:hypothetical protein
MAKQAERSEAIGIESSTLATEISTLLHSKAMSVLAHPLSDPSCQALMLMGLDCLQHLNPSVGDAVS